ncbi:MAG: hypothetical protein COB23_02870 [Methylophaga sp.]|nr:MAG: hypothetical protein COB23_02870 [Methylophaga sp.]
MSKVIKIVAGILVLAVIGIVVAISTVDVNQYKGELIDIVEESTGRKLQIGGDLQFGFSLIPTIVVEDVKFSNAQWGSQAEMLSLDKFEVQVSLIPLLTGNIQINRVILIEPKILLETNKKGLGNWVFASHQSKGEKPEAEADTSLPPIVINQIQVKNATITYKDGVTGEENNLVIEKIVTESNSFDDPLSVIIKIAYNGTPIEVKGTLGSLKQLTGNDNYPVDLAIDVSDANIGIKGVIAKPMDGKGLDIDVSFNVDSLSKLSTLAGNNLPELGPVSFTGKVADTKGTYSIKMMKLLVGKTDLSGDITANIAGKRPVITANLTSNLIDLVELSGDEDQAEKEQSQNKERLFSADPLPLESLKSVNANVTINVQQIKTSSLVLEKTKVVLTLKDGNLAIKPLNAMLAGGELKGHLGLNTSGKTASLAVDLEIKGLEPSQFVDKISGAKTDVSINIKGHGNSISQIMAGLNGQFLVKADKGVVDGSIASVASTDLLTMLNPTSNSSEGTQLNCMVVNFDIKDGIATADKGIALATSQMNIIGSGTIDLRTEKLDIGITPQAREGVGISVGQLADLVRLGGTLANPKPTTDVKAALATGLSAGTAIATGGLSLLAQGLLDRTTADADPCATALGLKPAPTAVKKQPESTTKNNTVDKVKDVSGAITDKLKKLF